MKKNYFTLGLIALVTFCLVTAVNAQTIRRCNNNPGITGVNVYTTIQAAHDAAVAGDIIYVEPSATNYGELDCVKRLTIIGNGYLLNANSNTPTEKLNSTVGNVTFRLGSALSTMTGMSVLGFSFQDASIVVSRTSIASNGVNLNSGASNCTIQNCLLKNGAISANGALTLNLNVIGNIIFKPEQSAISNITNATITNNLIYSEVTGSIHNASNCTITNNIFDFRNSGATAKVIGCSTPPCAATNTVSNNICLAKDGLPVGNGNVNGANALVTFQVANPWDGYTVYNTNFTQDAFFQLAAGSPAAGIGTGGTDAGAFGGANPYVLSGLPPYPIITNFTTSGVGNTNTPLQVSVTVRGSN